MFEINIWYVINCPQTVKTEQNVLKIENNVHRKLLTDVIRSFDKYKSVNVIKEFTVKKIKIRPDKSKNPIKTNKIFFVYYCVLTMNFRSYS